MELDAMTKRINQRSEERVAAALPVRLGNKTGLTRDVSVSGISFEIDDDYKTGSEISFMVEVATPTGKMMLKCHGSVVRTEARGKKTGVSVKITESVMEAAD
jgi:hypothetical protein